MIFDTDIFIWVQRGNIKAARLIESEDERLLSVQTYMELLQCAENRQQHENAKSFLKEFGFGTLPLSENIGHRAAVYIEEYGLSHGLRAGDAIIAATAAEHGLTLCTGNARHFNPIRDLKTRIFRPEWRLLKACFGRGSAQLRPPECLFSGRWRARLCRAGSLSKRHSLQTMRICQHGVARYGAKPRQPAIANAATRPQAAAGKFNFRHILLFPSL